MSLLNKSWFEQVNSKLEQATAHQEIMLWLQVLVLSPRLACTY